MLSNESNVFNVLLSESKSSSVMSPLFASSLGGEESQYAYCEKSRWRFFKEGSDLRTVLIFTKAVSPIRFEHLPLNE